jgi:hypothetical protein
MMASSIGIMPYMMEPGDYKIVAEALSKYMRNPGHFENPPVYTGPTAELAGTWNVTVQYIRGVGKQQFVLQQKDTSLTGEHVGEIYKEQLQGKVEADHVVLTSAMSVPGQQRVPYIFTGVLSGGTLSGSVKLGEYGAATFTAVKA